MPIAMQYCGSMVGDNMSKITRAAKDLLRAAKQFREASNNLYWAQNPEEFVDQNAPSEEEAQDEHHEAFLALESAEYYMQKALRNESTS